MGHGPSKNRKLSREHTPINLISIMNLFIVIIPMLISMWAAFQMAVLYIDVSGGGAGSGASASAANDEPTQTDNIRIGLFQGSFELVVEDANGKRIWEQKLPVHDSNGAKVYPLTELEEQLKVLREKYSQKNSKGEFVYSTVGIFPDPQLKYDILLKTIDICKYNNFVTIKYLTSQMAIFAGA
jgi:hypothetical protein